MSTRRAVSHAQVSRAASPPRRDETAYTRGTPSAAALGGFQRSCLGSSFRVRKTGVCPRVAVRFAKILRVSPSARCRLRARRRRWRRSWWRRSRRRSRRMTRRIRARVRGTPSETPNVPRNLKPGCCETSHASRDARGRPRVARRRRRRAAGVVRRGRRRRRNTGGGVWRRRASTPGTSAAEALTKVARDGRRSRCARAWRRRMRTRVTTARRGGSPARASWTIARWTRRRRLRFAPGWQPALRRPDDDAMSAHAFTHARRRKRSDTGGERSRFRVECLFLARKRARRGTFAIFDPGDGGFDCSSGAPAGADDQPGDRRAVRRHTALTNFSYTGIRQRNRTKRLFRKRRNVRRESPRASSCSTAPRRSAQTPTTRSPAPARDSCVASSPSVCFAGSASRIRRAKARRELAAERFFSEAHSMTSFAAKASVRARRRGDAHGAKRRTSTRASPLSGLCAAVFGPGTFLDKTEQTSRWDERPLRPSQIRYAALDALAPRLALGAMLERRARADVPRATVRGVPALDADTRASRKERKRLKKERKRLPRCAH